MNEAFSYLHDAFKKAKADLQTWLMPVPQRMWIQWVGPCGRHKERMIRVSWDDNRKPNSNIECKIIIGMEEFWVEPHEPTEIIIRESEYMKIFEESHCIVSLKYVAIGGLLSGAESARHTKKLKWPRRFRSYVPPRVVGIEIDYWLAKNKKDVYVDVYWDAPPEHTANQTVLEYWDDDVPMRVIVPMSQKGHKNSCTFFATHHPKLIGGDVSLMLYNELDKPWRRVAGECSSIDVKLPYRWNGKSFTSIQYGCDREGQQSNKRTGTWRCRDGEGKGSGKRVRRH